MAKTAKTAKTSAADETRSRAEALVDELVANGDLDNLVHLARLIGSAQDALTDDMVTRLAATAAGGIDLLDRANRSGVARALPAIAALVENGDLDRLVELARLVGSAQDALSDDMVSRLARVASEGMILIDRLTRADGVMNLIRLLERPEVGETLATLLGALAEAHSRVQEAPAKGGLGGAVRLMSDPGTQNALRLMAEIGKALGR